MKNTLMILVVFCLSICSKSEGLLKITVEPSDVVEGEPVTLTCTSNISRFYYITWYRNDTRVARCRYTNCYNYTSYYNITVNGVNRTSSIYIQNVSKSRDSVTWKCEDTQFGFDANTTLDVKERTGNLTLIRPENTRFIAGQSIDIACKTEVTYPTTNITWYIDTVDKILYEDKTTGIQDRISTSRLRLTLEKQLNNRSLYCSAFNGYGQAQKDFLELDVTYPPTIHILTEATSISIAEGGQLLLTCSVQDANPRVPPHGYTWSRNGIKLIDQTSDIYKVDSSSSHDTGNYTCTGNNGIGIGISSPVKVYSIPRVYDDKPGVVIGLAVSSGVVVGLAVGLALFMVLSIVLALLVAYLMLTIRRSTTKTNESEDMSRITPVIAAPNNTINEVSDYDGLELGNRDDVQYTSINAALVPAQIHDNQTSDVAGAKGDNSLYENV